jgi:hypothetical protein
MCVDNTSSKTFEEIRGILHENEKKLPSLVKSILKEEKEEESEGILYQYDELS